MIVYDITDMESFKAVPNWFVEIEKFASTSVNKLLIGNKADKAGERKVTYEQGLEMATKYGVSFVETSAKSSTNVQESFKKLTEDIQTRILKGPTPNDSIVGSSHRCIAKAKPIKKLVTGKSLTEQSSAGM